jgi:hypothetical protein
MYLLRELVMILVVRSGGFDMWALNSSAANFYNFFFAFIGLVFGQSKCIDFCLFETRKLNEKFYYKRISIKNDQKVMNWLFLMFFASMAVMGYGFFL